MIPDILTGTRLFMEASGQSIAATPAFPDDDTRALRRALLCEELGEYITAEAHGDLVEVVDGLLDIIVVATGSLLSYAGVEASKACAAEVVRSNLSKIVDGAVIKSPAGKVQKPASYSPPDIDGTLRKMGWEGTENGL